MEILLFFRRLRSVCIKELFVILKDKSSRAILVTPVLIQTLLFGYAVTYDLNYAPYVVCDQSRSELSRDLLAHIDGATIFSREATLSSPAQIEEWIYDGKALLAIQIPPDFADRLHAGRQADIQIILDGRNSTTAGMAQSYIAQIVNSWNASRGMPQPVTLKTRSWFNPQLDTRWNIIPGLMVTLSFIQIFILSALSVARERELGTFDQMLVTPLSPWEILVGKALPPILIGLVQASLIFLISRFWFSIPFAGELFDLFVSLAVFTLSISGMGLCISAIALSMQQAFVYSFVFLMPMILLSGLTTPVNAMPELLQTLTCTNPVRFAIVCVRRIYLEGAGLADIAENFIPMLCMAGITLPLACWLFRNRLH